jgi:hypothetical protein
MADSAYLREKMAAAITEATHVSLHFDDPAGIGANEISGGTPAYARVAITAWDAGTVDGVYTATLAGSFDVPPNTEVTWAGLWNGATYLDKAPAFVSTITQEVVQILSLTFVVPDPATVV